MLDGDDKVVATLLLGGCRGGGVRALLGVCLLDDPAGNVTVWHLARAIDLLKALRIRAHTTRKGTYDQASLDYRARQQKGSGGTNAQWEEADANNWRSVCR